MQLVQEKLGVNFETEKWPQIVGVIGASFHFLEDEVLRFARHKTAQLIGAIPVLAGCDHPMRTAISNLATYHIGRAEGKKIFEHTPEDDKEMFSRLHTGMTFQGGDEMIIRKGMDLLALQMLEGYKRDIETDKANGKYNPLGSGAWDYESTKESLIERIEAVECSEMDKIFSMADTEGSWGP